MESSGVGLGRPLRSVWPPRLPRLGPHGSRSGGPRARTRSRGHTRAHTRARVPRFWSIRLARIWQRRRVRIAVIALIPACALLAGGWVWLRHSSLVSVEHVRVTGVEGMPNGQGARVEAALEEAARGMSTLDVSTARLQAAVAAFPIVRSVKAQASFPHGLRIEVSEQPPVAALALAGTRTAAAADGVVLGAAYLSSGLPVVSAGRVAQGSDAAQSQPLAAGGHVTDGPLLQELSVLGAAPGPLAKLIERAYIGPEGLTVALKGGVLAYFGNGELPHAKWISLVRVLADPSSAGAIYVDVRLPERPAAGFAPGTKPTTSGEAGAAEQAPVAAPATEAELAASLESDVGASGGGGSPTAAQASEPAASEPSSQAAGEVSSTSSETSSSASGSGVGSAGEGGEAEAAPTG
jgi:cell division protein FtsQ